MVFLEGGIGCGIILFAIDMYGTSPTVSSMYDIEPNTSSVACLRTVVLSMHVSLMFRTSR